MRTARRLRLIAATLAGALALAALPSVAGAVLAGTNGRIVFASGRDVSDAEARLHFWRVPATALDPAVSATFTPTPGVQHRHPTWAPDRTRLAYARGTGGVYDIFIQDLTVPGAVPVNITNTPAVSEDRPAWSPDGTRIAYESAGADILIDTLPPGGPVNFTPNEAQPAGKPAWTPDSATVFYTSGAVNTAGDAGIVRKPANTPAALPSNVAAAPTINEHQVSISPDGTRLCFTRGGFDGGADVIVSLLNGGAQTILSDSNTGGVTADFGDYNCTWSPDGTQVAYVRGTFGLGDLVVERADGSEFVPRPLVESAGRFDGNPDWAPDGRPVCEPRSVTTPRDTPVAITLACPDTGPAYERTPVRLNVADPPANGTIPEDPTPPSATGTATLTYTPRAGFTGTDAFTYNGFDELGFATRVSVSIAVTAPGAGPGPGGGGGDRVVRCAGLRPTIVGTSRGETLRGTRQADVIAALGGNDIVRSLGGDDVVCLGGGSDRAFGGLGADRILGQAGRDRLFGNAGPDLLSGGAGRDVLVGGPGPDRLLGGAARDVLIGGAGRDTERGGPGADLCRALLVRSC